MVAPSVAPEPVAATRGVARDVELDWRAAVLGAAGLALTFAAPGHRMDLFLIGLLASAAGIVWNPPAGVLLTGAALPFFFFGRPFAGPLSITPPGLALMLTWLAALVVAAQGRLKLRWPRTGYDGPLALWLLAALLSLLVTEYLLLSARELRAVILEPVAFFWLISTLRGSVRYALFGLLLSATLTGAIASAQVLFGSGGTFAEGVLRAQTWYPSPNHLALMLGRAWPYLVAAALAWRSVCWIPAAIVGAGIVLTFSTGGWLGTAVATLVVLAALGHRRIAISVAALAVVAFAVSSGLAIAGLLPERLNPLRQTGGFRIDLWLSSLQMVRDHPLLGVGMDNFAYLYRQIYIREGAAAEPNLSHPHNWALNVWLELGLLGLVAFGWLVVRFVRNALRWTGPRWIAAGALGCMADMLVHGALDNSYFLVDLAFVFWITLGLVAGEATIEAT
jgi:O-antigen ligase